MTDIALPMPSAPSLKITSGIRFFVIFVVFALLAAINLSLTKTLADRYCNTRFGAFSSGFSKGFFVDRRGCPFLQSDAVPLGMP